MLSVGFLAVREGSCTHIKSKVGLIAKTYSGYHIGPLNAAWKTI